MSDRNDRLGVAWGYAGGTTLASVAEAIEAARYADQSGFDSLWISHAKAVDPIVALACAANEVPNLSEVGTSVVPLYGRHPIGLAQLAMTAQSTLDGRFTLGIGAGARRTVEGELGISWDRPFTFTRDFIDGLQPLLAGEQADVDGAQLTTHAKLEIEAPNTPVLLAALGPRMLELAGQRVDGTSVGQCGPRTIASYVGPTIRAGAEAAGRPAPRIMALIRICVTDNHAAAYAVAREVAAHYQAVPSYAAVLAKEDLAEAADLHLIGSWEQVLDGLATYAEAGTTDFRIQVAAHDSASWDNTQAALTTYLS
ncbi:MAG: TIGR03564 family F420-dependent LLM class oxidoreductase [Actinomycetia bacterium]|nr:TIGR03564 family F420-dependent LLM class oxidoreductase [Actinomycetes bacterium]